jgi:hypothetical protein
MNTPVIHAHEVNLALSRGWLRLQLLATFGALVATALFDFLSVWLLMRQKFTDDLGNNTSSAFMVATVAVMTLALYALAGREWEQGRRKLGWAFYLGAIVLVLWALADWAEPWNAGYWQRFHPGGNAFSPVASQPVTGWFDLLIDIPLALAFSACGLLFIRLKARFGRLVEQWRRQEEASAKIAQEQDAVASEAGVARLIQAIEHLEANFVAINEYLVRRALDAEVSTIEAQRQAILQKARSILTSEATRQHLTIEADKLALWLASLSASNDDGHAELSPPSAMPPKLNGKGKAAGAFCALLLTLPLLSPHPAQAQSSAEACASAPVFQLLLDVSGSSPLADPQYLAAVIPIMTERIRALPMCSTVLIVTVGDARVVPSMPRAIVLARPVPGKGTTRDEIARGVRQLLLTMPERIAKGPQERSELIAAFADAARNTNLQAKEPNQIVMLSDGVESSNLADCEKKARCRFPPPSFALAGTSVAIYGVGLGLTGERAMALTNDWEKFFAKAGVKADLRRTF